MSLSGRFCLRCGKPETLENPLIEGLCLECFLKERSLVRLPDRVALTRCPACGSIYLKGTWLHFSGGVRDALQHYLRALKKPVVSPNLTEIDVEVLGIHKGEAELLVKSCFKGRSAEQRVVIRYEVINRLCPKCLGVKVKDYNAVLQVRFAGSPSRELTNEVVRTLTSDREISGSITDYEELQEGIDVKFSIASVARQAAMHLRNSLGGYLTESWKLHGLVKGKRHSKLFVVLRIPVFTSGDLIDSRGVLLEVLNVKEERVTVRRLSDGKLLNLSIKSLVKDGFRQLSRDDYVTTECLVTEALGREAVMVCEDGTTAKWETARPLKAGDRVSALTYKDVRYIKIR